MKEVTLLNNTDFSILDNSYRIKLNNKELYTLVIMLYNQVNVVLNYTFTVLVTDYSKANHYITKLFLKNTQLP